MPSRFRRIGTALYPLVLVGFLSACGGPSSSSGTVSSSSDTGGGGGTGVIGGGNAIAVMPDWNDELAAYEARSLSTVGAPRDITEANSSTKLDSFSSTSSLNDTHDDTEGDDLWTAYHMYRRLDGIRQNAADLWFQRAQSLAGFFKSNYIDGQAWADDSGFAHDHLYGWGLCDWAVGENDTAAVSTIDEIVARMSEFFGPNSPRNWEMNPGDFLLNVAPGGRRWARQLRFAVCAAEVSPTSENIAWRDKVIELMLQAPDWDEGRGAYWLDENPTDKRLGSGSYATGDRITITFHMGIWMDALWHAWLATGREDVAERLVDMAEFYRDFPLNASGLLTLNLGYNINDGSVIYNGGDGSPDGVYTIPPINGLVAAYKLTGDASFLNHAWLLYKNWQEQEAGVDGEIDHFVDTEISPNWNFLANNKGELQYTYMLFENGGLPTVLAAAGWAEPSWYVAANDKTWIDMNASVGSMRWNDPAIHAENYLDLGSNQDNHQAAIRKWNGAIAREDFYVIALSGGHNGGSGNVIYEFGPFSSETPDWHSWGTDSTKYEKPSTLNEGGITDWRASWSAGGEWCRDTNTGGAPDSEQNFYSDGKPVSRHTYSIGTFIPDLGGGFGRQGFWPSATGVWCDDGNSATPKAASITFRSNVAIGADYDERDLWPNAREASRFGGSAFNPNNDKVITIHLGSGSDGTVVEYDPVWKTSTVLSKGAPSLGKTSGLAIDWRRRIGIVHHNGGNPRLLVIDLDHNGARGGTYGNVIEVGSYAAPFNSENSVVYHPTSRAFLGYAGGSTIYKMEPPTDYRTNGTSGDLNPSASWSWSAVSNGAGGATPGSDTDEGGLQSRMRWIKSIDGLAVQIASGHNGTDDRIYVYKLPEDGL